MQAYESLVTLFDRRSVLSGAHSLLHWDATVLMPSGAAPVRGEQMARLEVMSHELIVDPHVGEWLDRAENEPLDDWRRANLKGMRHAWVHANAVPSDLVGRMAEAGSACEQVWRTARAANDFKAVRPYLETVVALVRETAQAKAGALGVSPYEALLDQFDPGRRKAEIDPVFARLEEALPPLIDRVRERQARETVLPLGGPFPVEAQRMLTRRVCSAIGFDFEFGRLDESHHPFSTHIPGECRITTRYHAEDFTKALMGVIHETGHALYDRGLPEAWRGQPVGDALGMSIHESQSLLMEMQACRSTEFLRWLAPVVAEAFGRQGDTAFSADNLHRHYTRVTPGLIRIDADEATYPLHVILRYRLEQAMISGDLAVADLPGAWNETIQRMLGVTPPGDGQGCMQDIHWHDGAFGYFPTYTLGAILAAQFFAKATAEHASILPGIAEGNFVPLLAWLRTHIHSHGSRYSATELTQRVTGGPLDAEAFLAHLERRYLPH